MAVYTKSFIFDGIASDYYGLFISEIDAGGINESMASFDLNVKEEKLFRRNAPYFYGAESDAHLEFEVSAYSEEEISAEDSTFISRWLFGSKNYKKFQYVQPDMQNVFFWAILSSPEAIRSGNIIQGIRFKVTCNAPFGFTFPKTTTYTYTDAVVNANEMFYNSSDNTSDYLYPRLVLTMNSTGGDVSITNAEDSGRVFGFTELQADEVLTIDNSLQTISSSSGLKRLGSFNKKWLRFLPNKNNLTIVGNLASIELIYSFVVKKVG
jgi:phage-related protein